MTRFVFCLALLFLSTGCGSVKSFLPMGDGSSPGDQMLTQSKQTKSLAKTWNKGQDLVEKGEKLLSKSEQLALESQKARTEAQGMIAQGKSLLSNSERSYETAFGEMQRGSINPETMTREEMTAFMPGGSMTR